MERFVEACRAAAAGVDPVHAVTATVADAIADPAAVLGDIPEFDGDDHPVLSEPGMAVYVVRQRPLVEGPPHDHGMVAVIGMLAGDEVHRRFRRDGDRIEPDGSTRVGPGQVIALEADEVHAIANPNDGPSVGLHVYLGDLASGERTLWNAEGRPQRFTDAGYSVLEGPFRG